MSAPLTKGAEAVRRYLAESGDSLSGARDGADLYWAFTRSGLPVRGRDVRALKAAGLIVPFGAQIDPESEAACYILAPASQATACGARSIWSCERKGFCLNCAPSGVVNDVRAGSALVEWHGIRP